MEIVSGLVKAPRTLLVLAILVLGLGTLAAGCGDDEDSTTVTETVGTDGSDTGTVEPTTGTEGGSDSAVEGGGAQTLSTASGKLGPHYFQTPSENIGCFLSRHDVRCDIRERTWSPPPEPKSCKKIGLDYGQGIAVGKTHAEFVCAGDTSLGGPDTLEYGQNARRGVFRCHSGQKGITCSNATNGHGFFLSRESYRIF